MLYSLWESNLAHLVQDHRSSTLVDSFDTGHACRSRGKRFLILWTCKLSEASQINSSRTPISLKQLDFGDSSIYAPLEPSGWFCWKSLRKVQSAYAYNSVISLLTFRILSIVTFPGGGLAPTTCGIRWAILAKTPTEDESYILRSRNWRGPATHSKSPRLIFRRFEEPQVLCITEAYILHPLHKNLRHDRSSQKRLVDDRKKWSFHTRIFGKACDLNTQNCV